MRFIIILISLLSLHRAQAQSCQDIYAAIRREAMYCGFFCDWKEIRTLQVEYESRCMRSTEPMSIFDRDILADELAQESDRADGDLNRHAAGGTAADVPTRAGALP